MEEKYGKTQAASRQNTNTGSKDDGNDPGTDSSSESEDEDDEGVLASEALDAQIDATLKAIRNKDPRVYDEQATFYTDLDDGGNAVAASSRPVQKPMYLSDYHRRNLLEEANDADMMEEHPTTYAQEQDELRSTIVQEMHATVDDSLDDEATSQKGDRDGDSGDNFLIRKPSKSDHTVQTSTNKRIELDVEIADKDPDTYLSKFLAARAWLPSAGSQFQPFESDDEEDEERAEAFEEAYNMRFENPQTANEKLISHARDAAARYSVRKETTNSRKKARDADRAKMEMEKQEREEEKARLRKLQVAEAEDKVRKIKQAAGLRGRDLKEEDWSALLNEGWDDARWEQEMKRRFGEQYYADRESGDEAQEDGRGKRKLKKPKWDDDIEINDLVPDFETNEESAMPRFDISDEDVSSFATEGQDQNLEEDKSNSTVNLKAKKNKNADAKREREEQKRESRKERRVIEKIIDGKLKVEDTIAGVGSKKTGHFRYRDTSPLTFGMTARDILMASDSQLNQYAGLKKMAAFRDSEKKKKDKKRLGKKARLREWRKETFGSEQGPQKQDANVLANRDMLEETHSKLKFDQTVDIKEGKKRRKRSKKDQALKKASVS